MPIITVGTFPTNTGTPIGGTSSNTGGILPVGNPSSGYGSDTFSNSSIAPVGEIPPTSPPPVGDQPQGSLFDRVGKFLGFGEFSVGSMLKGAGVGAAISGVVSAIKNGMAVAKGQSTTGRAVGNFVGDALTGAIGGLGFALGSNLGMMGFSALGLAGLPLTIAGIVTGTVAAVGAGKLFGKVKGSISNSVASMFGDKSSVNNKKHDNNDYVDVNKIDPSKLVRIAPAYS